MISNDNRLTELLKELLSTIETHNAHRTALEVQMAQATANMELTSYGQMPGWSAYEIALNDLKQARLDLEQWLIDNKAQVEL